MNDVSSLKLKELLRGVLDSSEFSGRVSRDNCEYDFEGMTENGYVELKITWKPPRKMTRRVELELTYTEGQIAADATNGDINDCLSWTGPDGTEFVVTEVHDEEPNE